MNNPILYIVMDKTPKFAASHNWEFCVKKPHSLALHRSPPVQYTVMHQQGTIAIKMIAAAIR